MVITPDFLPENKTLTPELVATLPKICLQSRGDLSTILAQAKNRHVMYVEHLAAVADVPRLANIAEESSIMVGFVVDCTGPADLEAIMDDPTGLIVGAVAHTPEVAALLRNALVPYIYDGSVLEQVIYAAARITDAIGLVSDFQLTDDAEIIPTGAAVFVLDRNLPLLCQPAEDIRQEKIEIMSDHPLVLLDSMGFNVAVDDMTAEVIEAIELEIDQYYRLLHNTLEASFLPMRTRMALREQVIEPAFAELVDAATDVSSSSPASQQSAQEPPISLTPEQAAAIDPALLAELGITWADLGLE